ncbi:thioesterase family protein [Algoriphagus aquimarinus]|uniref:acyl-CoA thioesterase n=1 Tax=Algoriphagus aquimarinus TaxID=237018 RepID=UPI0030D773E6
MIKPDPAELQREIEFSLPIQIRFSDIDGYLHVNNGVYFNYFEHARAVYLFQVCDWNVMEVGSVVGRIEMDYFRPIHIDDAVRALVKCSRIGNTSFDLEQYLVGETKEGDPYTFAKSKCILVSVDMKTMKPMPLPENYRAKLQPKS